MKRCFNILTMTLVACLLTLGTCGGRKAPPDSMTAQLSFGVEMAKRGLWSEALFRFKQAGRLSPENPRILNNMAVAYEALGNFERALTYYQDAIKADPTNRELKRNYSRFVEFYRAFKPAEKAAEKAAEEKGGEAPKTAASSGAPAPSGP